MGQLHIAGITLHGACDAWTIIHLTKEGEVNFESADGFMGLGNFAAAEKLHEKYGKKVSLALCGPVGEYQGIVSWDSDQRCRSASFTTGGSRRGGRRDGDEEGQSYRRRARSIPHFARP